MKFTDSQIRLALKAMRAHAHASDHLRQVGILCKHFNAFVSPGNHTRSPLSPEIGKDTKFRRPRFLRLFLMEVRGAGFKLDYIDELTVKHVRAVVRIWDQKQLATRTLQTRLSAIRMLFSWMGLERRLPRNRELLPPHRWNATTVAVRDKSWSGNKVDVEQVASWMTGRDTWIKIMLLLARYFGLRTKEATLLRPHEADEAGFLNVYWGPKGGRLRKLPIETTRQREVLDAAKAFAHPGESLIGRPDQMTWRAAQHRLNQVMRDHDITRALAKVTPHGLRVEFACEQYFLFTGEPAPVCGGKPVPRKVDRAARKRIAELLGHGRSSVTSAYIGRVLRQKKPTNRGGLK